MHARLIAAMFAGLTLVFAQYASGSTSVVMTLAPVFFFVIAVAWSATAATLGALAVSGSLCASGFYPEFTARVMDQVARATDAVTATFG